MAKYSGLGGEPVKGVRQKCSFAWELKQHDKCRLSGDDLAQIAKIMHRKIKDVYLKLSEKDVMGLLAGYDPSDNDSAEDSDKVVDPDWTRFEYYSAGYADVVRLKGYIDPEMEATNFMRWALYQRIKVRNMKKTDQIASKLYIYRIYREGKEGKHDLRDPHPKSWSLRFKDEWDPKMWDRGVKPPWW